MSAIRLGLIGAGNIMSTRHANAIVAAPARFDVRGVADTHIERAQAVARKLRVKNASQYDRYAPLASALPWLGDVEAVIIGTPPFEHEQMVREALSAGKHVLVEKPFVIDVGAGQALAKMADDAGLVLAVNHNFQYASSFRRLERDLREGRLGTITSFYSAQFSNGTRRLPAWSEALPGGLFYDESPHVLYLLRKFSGSHPELVRAWGTRTRKPATPDVLQMDFDAGGIPASVYVNFISPLCEWTFAVIGTDGVGIVDLFRDIYGFLPNDGQHLMKEVFTTSALATAQHWRGFFNNGLRYVRNRLHYGFDETHGRFAKAIAGDRSAVLALSADEGLAVNRLQHLVIERVF